MSTANGYVEKDVPLGKRRVCEMQSSITVMATCLIVVTKTINQLGKTRKRKGRFVLPHGGRVQSGRARGRWSLCIQSREEESSECSRLGFSFAVSQTPQPKAWHPSTLSLSTSMDLIYITPRRHTEASLCLTDNQSDHRSLKHRTGASGIG